jgi:hypothetical protein
VLKVRNGFILRLTDDFAKNNSVLRLIGAEKNVHEFVIRVKQLPWQKVQIKELQTSRSDGSNGSTVVDNFRKFTQFEEKYFKNQNATTDLGLLHVFLREKNFPNIFNLYFGIDGRETNQVSLNKK